MKIEELINAATRACNAVADYYEKQSNPLLPLGLAADEVYPRREPAPAPLGEIAAPPKTRAKKEKSAAPAPAPLAAPTGDPLMQSDTTQAPPAAAPVKTASAVAGMTEDQSLDRAKELAKLIVEAYPEKESSNRPKGFRLAMELLSKFKVARTTDLIHAQRLQFITEGDLLLAAAPKPAGVA